MKRGHSVHRSATVCLSIILAIGFALLSQSASADGPWAQIKNLNVTPRITGEAQEDIFDVVSPGLNTVGINKIVYLSPAPISDALTSITAYAWAVVTEPSAGALVIDLDTEALLKVHATEAGEYILSLTPSSADGPTTASTIRLWASAYKGARVGAPSCVDCHSDEGEKWAETGHASFLTKVLNGEEGGYYGTSCMNCHAVGTFQTTVGDGSFYDVATTTGFDITQIPGWVADAFTTGTQHWDDLPSDLQDLGNIQCESCHGPGAGHAAASSDDKVGAISGGVFDAEVCSHCHDAPTHHMHPYEWRDSKHEVANGASHNSSCAPCHTAEGFAYATVKGEEIPEEYLHENNGITCVACHDPHDDSNAHQLRTVAAVTLPNGAEFDKGAGNICANCHHSRTDDAAAKIDLDTGSFRGAHHGPQTDVLLGTTAYDWGTAYPASASVHYEVVEDGCVTCHMGTPPSDGINPPKVGAHSFTINTELGDGSTTSSVATACGSCHPGIETTDRMPVVPEDFDGDGLNEGVQSEVAGIIENLKTLLAAIEGTEWDEHEKKMTIEEDAWSSTTLNERGALYNFNLISEDKSLGIHNPDYAIAVLQRSYKYLTSNTYVTDFPAATMVDTDGIPQPPTGPGLVEIHNLSVTPRMQGEGNADLDIVSTGLNNVGIGKTVYLQPKAVADEATSITSYVWGIFSEPSAGATTINVETSDLLKIVPTVGGEYIITLTPMIDTTPSTATSIRLWATTYLGVAGGDVSCASCHAETTTKWTNTGHATFLKDALNGAGGTHYSSSCTGCHGIGAFAGGDDDSFFDVAEQISFDTSLLGTWAIDAATNGTEHWNDLPVELQAVAGIQCESCHGPGGDHLGVKENITGGQYDAEVCSHCHDAPTHHMRPYEWRDSKHEIASEDSHSGTCVPCHTAEGFAYKVKGEEIPEDLHGSNGITCVACHDPHDDSNAHQLRTVAAVTLPNGSVFDKGVGNVCANCHNSRTSDAATSSYRGAHYGPQSDVFLGTTAYDWGLAFPAGASVHYEQTEDACVTCHMAAPPSGGVNPPKVGAHSFTINTELGDGSTTSTVGTACGGCHPGLESTDRVLPLAQDFDGDGIAEGIQSEVSGILMNLSALLTTLPGATGGENGEAIGTNSTDWKTYTADEQGALFNYNLIAKDSSLGVHNVNFALSVLQRSYLHLTGNLYNEDFPAATMVDTEGVPQPPMGPGLVDIANLSVTPRMTGEGNADLDIVSTGLNNVGIGKTVYLQPKATGDVSAVTSYVWGIFSEPSAGATTINVETSDLLKFVPTVAGEYIITLTPMIGDDATTATSIRIIATSYLGAAVGEASCTTCHAETSTKWETTNHATFLETALNGEKGNHYSDNCTGCHGIGAFAGGADGSFFDVAAQINFDTSLIGIWAIDAADNGTQHWDDLPTELQAVAGIQCESCHGPGGSHLGAKDNIFAGAFDAEVCNHCHDAPTHHMRPYQLATTKHEVANGSSHNSDCAACHTAEGFVYATVKGEEIPEAMLHDNNGITCVACHDPHDDSNEHQLRTVAAVTLPNGSTFDKGNGNICANCHNSRTPDAAAQIDLETGSYRGAHHGPQADVLMGTTAYAWGLDYPAGVSAHMAVTEDACVTCHMATAPDGEVNPPPVGDHTFRITTQLGDGSTTSTVEAACGTCHPGLDTTDRILLQAADFDGNRLVEGIQSEVLGLLANLMTELDKMPGTEWDAEERKLAIDKDSWMSLTLDQRGALYNFNLLSEDKSLGVHNAMYTIAVLQRSYLHLVGNVYNEDFRYAAMVDTEGVGPIQPYAPENVQASDGTFKDKVLVTWDLAGGATHYRVSRTETEGGVAEPISGWIEDGEYADVTGVENVTYYYSVQAAVNAAGDLPSGPSVVDSGWRDSPQPEAPTNVQASDGTFTDNVLVTWGLADGATHYRISRNQTNGAVAVAITGWIAATGEYADTTAAPGVTYYYVVEAAINAQGDFASLVSLTDSGWRDVEIVPETSQYKITYKKCTLALAPGSSNSLLVTSTDAKASLKIALMKKPTTAPDVPGKTMYLTTGIIPEITIDGPFGTISSVVNVKAINSTGAIKSISTKGGWVESIEAGSVATIKITAEANSVEDVFAAVAIKTTTPGTAMKLTLAGAILTSIDTAQELKYLKVSARKWKTKDTKQKVYSMGGIGSVDLIKSHGTLMMSTSVEASDAAPIGLVIAPVIKSISVKGCPIMIGTITADVAKITASGLTLSLSTSQVIALGDIQVTTLTSGVDIKSITAKARKFNGEYFGGQIGFPYGDPVNMIVTAPNILTISGDTGVGAIFIAGSNPDGTANFSGVIKKIYAKRGSIAGAAYISPAAEGKLKFKPEQGAFMVYTQ